MTSSLAQPPRRAPSVRRAGWAVLALVGVLLALSGCGGGSDDSDSGGGISSGVGDSPGNAQSLDAVGVAGAAPESDRAAQYDASSASERPLVGPALIKTASVALESSDIAIVIRSIDDLAVGTGGSILSEDTATNTHGVETRTRIVLTVPAADFDHAVDRIARLGDLVSRTRSSQDVTSQLVDVRSRVTSARDSIAQLRTLYARATKLRAVIDLERELSTREANLESLLAQQRSLQSSTSMSTITVNASRPAASPGSGDEDRASGGFFTGLKQGWHGLVVFVVAFAHGLGLILPLGILALLAVALGYVAIRRFTPRRDPHPSE